MIELQKSETNDLTKFINKINNYSNGIIIYGTGVAAREMYDFVTVDLRKKVFCFVDRVGKKTYCGLPVLELQELDDKESMIVIAASTMYDIEKRLDDFGFHDYIQVDPFILQEFRINKRYLETNRAIFNRDLKKINEVYDFIEDEKSKVVFNTVIQQRMCPLLKELKKIYDKNQYFGNDVIPKIIGNVIDCGAYDGDTLIRFLRQNETADYNYFAFEADKNNYEKICDYIRKNGLEKNVFVKNVAIWDRKQIVNFSKSKNDKEGVLGKINSSLENVSQSVDCINADSIDNLIINDINIGLIIMDIEGAEVNALYGAQNIIKKQNPCLAISVYHDFTHLYEIPLLIKKIYPNYKIFLRHHRWNVADTVCYAIP